jgi:hypothetical protein
MSHGIENNCTIDTLIDIHTIRIIFNEMVSCDAEWPLERSTGKAGAAPVSEVEESFLQEDPDGSLQRTRSISIMGKGC